MLARLAPGNARARRALLWVAVFAALLLFTQVLLPGDSRPGRGVPMAIVFQGVLSGLMNAMIAAGLILVYRASRIINFAQSVIGVVASVFVGLMTAYNPGFPFPLTLLIGLAAAGAVGATIELVFGRRFARAPRLVLTVVTIAGGSFLTLITTSFVTRLPVFPKMSERSSFDLDLERLHRLLPFSGLQFHIGSSRQAFGFPEILAIEIAVVGLIGLGVFFNFTRAGMAVRASAENAERAALLGIGVGALSTLVWAIAGVLSGAGLIADSLMGDPVGLTGGNVALLIPIAAAVVSRFRSIPAAVGVCVVIAVGSVATSYTYPDSNATISLAVFAVLALALLLQRRDLFREQQGEESSWQATKEPRPVPAEMRGIPALRWGRIAIVAVVALAVAGLPFLTAVRIQVLLSTIVLTSIAGLSLVVLVGWAGQVSLGQFAFVGVGAAVGGSLAVNLHWSFWLAVPAGTVAAGVVAGLVGIPALRVRGLYLAVATFAFAIAVQEMFSSPRYLRNHLPRQVPRPSLFFLDFDDERSMYFLCLVALAVSIVLVINLRRSRFGRLLIAARENEANVQSFGVSLVRLKVMAFVVSGGLAGFAGAIFAFQQRSVGADSFNIDRSLALFLNTIVGGVSSPVGALLGSVYANAGQYFFANNLVWGFVVGLLPLAILYIEPGGLIAVLNSVRDAWLRIVAQRRQLVVPSLFADYDPEVLARRLIPLAPPSAGQGLAALPSRRRFRLRSTVHQPQTVVAEPVQQRASRELAAIVAVSDSDGGDAGTEGRS
ncbi:MAG TPA: ABC transporter permease [Acidimicrobiales bacterium]|nr:ABC transporter permease [Acidimicrobiales bacterium]